MSMTDAERYKKWRKKQKARGRKQIGFLLSLEATDKLNRERDRTGKSIAEIINRLIVNMKETASKQPMRVASKQPSAPSKRPKKVRKKIVIDPGSP
jgi:hypothetical protein